jgi:hypothetical protein
MKRCFSILDSMIHFPWNASRHQATEHHLHPHG